MLWGLITLLCILWLFAVVAKFTLGGLIHLLLVIAVVVLIFRLITGRKVV
ncbi:MAG TPA: lmo0937 family membrane protein [Planctomycetaceae bacterium]|nr:lmo0937 family membrane protein [Planctomycetaceae bacterium]HQZ64568.1 lmo0937 family membrane protein [Planctomycetaceae bacterium]